MTVYDDYLKGFVWASNIGWLNVGAGTGSYDNTTFDNYGVNNDGSGNLSGFGWSENAGWVSFSNVDSQVTIDSEGNFSGYGYNANIGWTNFSSSGDVDYKVKTDWPPTPTATPSATPSVPPTVTPTPSVMPTPSGTPTPPPSVTPTSSPSPSVTPSTTPTPIPEVISVYLSMNNWDIGIIGLSETEELVEITATNDGNVTEDFTIYCEDGPGGWTIQSAVGEDSFTVKADVSPYEGYDITLEDEASPVTLATSVEAENTVYFKLQYSAPSSNTKVSGIPQDFDITITAIEQ